jgi:hypothetical protein
MPSTSKAQQQFMAIAEHDPEKLQGDKPDMSQQQLHDFASTPTKGLPGHAPKKKSARHRDGRYRYDGGTCTHMNAHKFGSCPDE